MALQRYTIDGYGQVELNNCAFRRDGRIEAQCRANTTDFASSYVENGMILAVDNVKRELRMPTSTDLPLVLVYSAEHIYDERTPGLKNFKLKPSDDFKPRCGYLAIGDKWTENCVCYDTTEYADDDAFETALEAVLPSSSSVTQKTLYGTYSSIGAIKVTETKPTSGLVLKVVEYGTMPDGSNGIKFQCFAI